MNVCDGLTYAELRIAKADELEIEHELIRAMEQGETWGAAPCLELRSALRQIDAWKAARVYERERTLLREKVAALLPPLIHPDERKMQEAEREWEHMANLFRGLKSPDPQERADFTALFERIRDMSFRDGLAFVRPLKKAKGAGGRPSAKPPWRHIAPFLEQMRVDVANGTSIPGAARAAAEAEGKAQKASRAEYFEQLYRDRMRLREVNPPEGLSP